MLQIKNVTDSFYDVDNLPASLVNELKDIRSYETKAGISIGYLLLNEDLLEDKTKPAIVAFGASLSDITMPDRAWEGVQLAFLEMPVLLLDIQGHGISSKHNKQQIIDLVLKRRITSHVLPLAETKNALLGDRPLHYLGSSHGAHIAIKLIEIEESKNVISALLIDLPAVKNRLTVALQAGLFYDNTIGRIRYLRALKHTTAYAQYNAFKKIHKSWRVPAAKSFVRNDTLLFILNLFSSVNSTSHALTSWNNINMSNKKTVVTAYTAEKGHISDWSSINNMLRETKATENGLGFQHIVTTEDHNISLHILMPRVAGWLQNNTDTTTS